MPSARGSWPPANPEAASLTSVTYFGNAFDTTTGVDLVSNYESGHFGGATTDAPA